MNRLRNTEYAHRAADGPAFSSIELGAIHAYIDVAERLVIKYVSVLFYESARLNPVDQTNWQTILMFPWIQGAERDTSVRYTAKPEVVLALFDALHPEEQDTVRAKLR